MTTHYRTAGLAILILLLFSLSGFADDGTAVGHLVAVEGDVRVMRAKSPERTELVWNDAAFGMRVYPGDQIKTGADGRAIVEMGDTTLTTIEPGSLFRISSSSPATDDNRHWKQLTEDLGVMLSTDERGVTRGRLYVLMDDRWTAVALESPEEFLPDVVPVGH